MPASFKLENNGLCLINVTDKISVDELKLVQANCDSAIQKNGSITLLVILDDFKGWQEGIGWDDSSFAERNDAFIKKIAIVGEDKWRDLSYVFTLKGLRPFPIEYFGVGQVELARAWVD
jgi:hypothetical protein